MDLSLEQNIPDMLFLNHFNFQSDTVTSMRALTGDIRMLCIGGNTIVINGWFTDGNVPIFNIDSVSLHCDIYKEMDWQGNHYIVVSVLNESDFLFMIQCKSLGLQFPQ